MARRLQDYVKYTTTELDQYTETEGSCVRKQSNRFHLTLGPYVLSDLKQNLMRHVRHKKVGYYDSQLDGIILDLKNVKVLGPTGALRNDDCHIHINITADCYVFKPEEGAVLSGIVKHIGKHHVGVIIYRVFSANIRLTHKICEDDVQMEQEVKFRIKKFNLQNILPYIEGQLLVDGVNAADNSSEKPNKITKFAMESNNDSTFDSGIEEKESPELDELITLIKEEMPTIDLEESSISPSPKKPKKDSKRKRQSQNCEAVSNTNINESFDMMVAKEIKQENSVSDGEELITSHKSKKDKRKSKAVEQDQAEHAETVTVKFEKDAGTDAEDLNKSHKHKNKKSKRKANEIDQLPETHVRVKVEKIEA